MPALCNVDYASMELLHAKLVRTATCVDGCRWDYTICGENVCVMDTLRPNDIFLTVWENQLHEALTPRFIQPTTFGIPSSKHLSLA